jgi:hypothetical protein
VEQEHTTADAKSSLFSRAETLGRELARYGLVVVVGWIGLMKVTAYEAEGISRYVANSPLMSWVYGFMSHAASRPFLASSRSPLHCSSPCARSHLGLPPSAAPWLSGCSSRL